MIINPVMQTIGSSLNIPTYPDEMRPFANDGDYPVRFITYNETDERPNLRGNNADICEGLTFQIHLFTKGGNPVAEKETLKAEIRKQGLSIQNNYTNYEQETGYYHYVITCWTWDVIRKVN